MTMKPFAYARATSVAEALAALDGDCRPLAGGTDLVGLMKEGLAAPDRLVDIKRVDGLDRIDAREDGWQVGAAVRLFQLSTWAIAADGDGLACLAAAIEQTASPQIRHMATLGGNLLQKPRCWYYRNPRTHCWLKGGPRCFAVRGDNRYHAILGRGVCQAVHASDPAVALVALDAQVTVASAEGERTFPLATLFQQPTVESRSQVALGPAELVTRVWIPRPAPGARGAYIKATERTAWDFALVSVAAQVTEMDGVIQGARVVLGGVGPMPWVADEAAEALIGNGLTDEAIEQASEAATVGARPLEHNGIKVVQAQGAVREALEHLRG